MAKAPAVKDKEAIFIQKVIGSDTFTVMAASRMELEDEYTGLYFTAAAPERLILMPPFDPKMLLRLVQTNNCLSQAVEAMEVNIDGTGYEFVPVDETAGAPTAQILKPPRPPMQPPLPDRSPPVPQPGQQTKLLPNGQRPPPPPPGVPSNQADIDKFHADSAQQDAQDKFEQDTATYQAQLKQQAQEKLEEAERLQLEGFFKEPYPNESFTSIRRRLRREIESIGYGFLEVLRNIEGDVVGIRNINTHQTRFIKLDAPIMVQKSVTRNGEEVNLNLWERERRFVQIVPGKPNQYMYFREYGSSREVNRKDGMWETPTQPIAPEDRGTELLVFGILPDIISPYYVPRWINNLPSVVGSRKAEEENLQFFDAGGVPPAIIFVEGGTIAQTTADQLRGYLSGQAKTRNRAVVIEAQSTSGALESAGKVTVKVERFGSSAELDAMWSKYDLATQQHVRSAFRIPDLFFGDGKLLNFATAMTSYMVAEAQVFQQERLAFDDTMNKTIMKELGAKLLKLRSLPITLKNVEIQLQALGIVLPFVDQKGVVDEVNKLGGLSLSYQAPVVPPGMPGGPPAPAPAGASGASSGPGGPQDTPKPPQMPPGISPIAGEKASPQVALGSLTGAGLKTERMSAKKMIELVNDYAFIHGNSRRKFQMGPIKKQEVEDAVAALDGVDEQTFLQLYHSLTRKTLVHTH